jgi:hypothetical protein
MLDWGLDRETQQEHYLQIGIKDRGKPTKTGFCQIIVTVLDVNDNPPVFTGIKCGAVMEEETSESQTAMEVWFLFCFPNIPLDENCFRLFSQEKYF